MPCTGGACGARSAPRLQSNSQRSSPRTPPIRLDSYPYACRQLGWLGFLVAVVLVALTEAFTLYALAKLSEHSKQQT